MRGSCRSISISLTMSLARLRSQRDTLHAAGTTPVVREPSQVYFKNSAVSLTSSFFETHLMASYSNIPIEPEHQSFIPNATAVHSASWSPPGSHKNLPADDEPYWKVALVLAAGSFICALTLFMGSSAGYAAAAMLMVGSLTIVGSRFARNGSCARPMLVTLIIVLVIVCFITMICAIVESVRLHVAVNENIFKCPCELKLSETQCSERAHAESHHVGNFNCFAADGTMCLLCTKSGAARVGVSCVVMWVGWLQQVVVCGYTFFILCCYVSPSHPYGNTEGSATVVMGRAIN